MQTMLKHIFCPIRPTNCSSLYATGVTRIQSVVLRQIGGRVVTCGHVTKMAVTPFDPKLPKTPCYTQTSRLYHSLHGSAELL